MSFLSLQYCRWGSCRRQISIPRYLTDMILTKVLSLACMGDTLGQVAHGAGRHEAYLSTETIKMGLKLNLVGQAMFLWAPCFVKLSIAIFLLRVTPNIVYRRVIQATITFLLVWTLSCFVTLLTQCRKIAVLWDSSIETTCWSTEIIHALGWASASELVPTCAKPN